MNVTKLHWKRLVSNLLVLVMLFSAMPAAAFAEDAQDTTETDLSVVQETTVPEPTAEPTPEPTAAPTDWAAKAAAVKLTGNWRNDLVAIAQTQLGYTEENGVSLYGEWNGTPEADWTALFINWVATQAGLSEKDFPHGDTYKYLRIVMNDKGALIRSSRYAYPSVGDLAMIEVDDKKLAGIITYIDNGYASVIHGDDNGAVTSGTYKISTSEFDFYVNLDVLMEKAGVDTGKGGQVPALPEDGVVAWTSANAVYVREEPTTASQRLATVKKSGTVLTVTSAQMADDGYIWYGIVYEGVVGYIRGDLLTLDKQALPPITPTPEPTPEPTPVPTEAPVVEATEVPVVEETAVPATLADVQALVEAAAAAWYRDFDGERWVLFETMLALMSNEELAACNEDITNVVAAIDALSEEDRAVILAQYAAELSFLVELQAEVAETLGKPSVTSRAAKWSGYDTEVSNGYFNIIKADTYQLLSGAREVEVVLNNADGNDRKVVHIFEVDASKVDVLPGYYGIDTLVEQYNSMPYEEYAATLPSKGTGFKYTKAEQLTKTVAYYQGLGYKVVGAMNTALAYDSDAPYGYMVLEGKVLTTPADHAGAQTYLAIDANGKAELRSMSTPLNGTEYFAVSANFGWLVKNGALTSTSVERTSSDASRSMIGIKADGTLLFVQVDGRNAPTSSGLSNYEMGEMMLALGCVNAVNCDGGGSSTFISKRAGDSSPVMRSIPSDGSERPTINSIILAAKGGTTGGKFERAEILSEYDYIAPYSVYPMDVVAIDNINVEIKMPEGGVWELADESFGSIDQNGVFTSNGTLGEVTVKYTVAGYTAEATITVAHPLIVEFAQASTVIPYGRTITLPLEAYADAAREFAMFYQVKIFDWELSADGAGVLDIDAQTFTATTDESILGVTLTATYKYAELDAIKYNIEFGKGSEILKGWDFESGDISEWMGFEEARAWNEANGVTNTLNGSNPIGGQFSPENDSRTFLANRSNGQVKNGNYALGVEIDNRNAEFANWTYNILYNVGGVRVLRDVANGQKAVALGMWVYIPEGAAGLAMQLTVYNTADHSSGTQLHFYFNSAKTGARINLNSATEEDIPANRWVYASCDLTASNYYSTVNPYLNTYREPTFIRTYIKPTAPANLVFYIDDITLDYSAAVDDREAPVIDSIMYATADESVALEGATIKANNATFTANVADYTAGNMTGLDVATAQIYLDGVKVDTVVSGKAMSTKTGVALTNGAHVITFEIADNLGNRAQKSVSFTVEAEENAALVYMVGYNDSGAKPEYDSLYYVALKTTDISKVEVVEANIRLNTANTWELEHMTVAAGFTVEYELLGADRDYITVTAKAASTDIHTVENVVHITLTKTDDCVLTGEQTLVTLPVRVWSWSGVDSVTGAVITPEQQFASGNCPVVTIDVDVRYGRVETADDENVTFNGSMSVETMLNDNVNPWHYHDAELTVQNLAATCTEPGYENRTYCETCRSVVDWGTKIEATGHTYEVVGDQLVCDCGAILGGNGIVSANGKLYCLIADKLVTGWQMVEGDASGWCYADPTTKEVVVGERTVSGITYTFDENGITAGAWYTDSKGTKYSYGPAFLNREWKDIDGATYYFGTDCYMYVGVRAIAVNRNNIKEGYHVYDFGNDGKMVNDNADYNGIISTDGDGMFYMVNGVSYYGGLMLIDGYYYYARTSGQLVCGMEYWPTKLNDLLPAAKYSFGDDGKMLNPPVVEPEPDPEEPVEPEKKNGIVEEDGKLYWYVDDVKTYGGLLYLDTDGDETPDAYYYARSNGEIVCGQKYWITKNNDLLPVQYYTFGDDGKMIDPPVVEEPDPEPDPEEPVEPEKKNGIVEEDGKLYWYVDDVKTYGGLLYLDTDGDDVADAYYYARSNGEIVCGKQYWITKTNDLLPAAYYTFGDDGKMIDPPVVEEPDPEPDPDPEVPVEPEKKNGIVEEDGKLYWYVDDVKTYGGLLYLDTDGDGVADAYYYARTSGEIVCGRTYWITKTNDLLPVGGYTFGDDGKMIDPPVAE